MEIRLEHTKQKWIWLAIAAVVGLVFQLLAQPPVWTYLLMVAGFYLIIMVELSVSKKLEWLKAAVSFVGGAILTFTLVQYIILDPENFNRTCDQIIWVNIVLIFIIYMIAMLATNWTALACTISHMLLLTWGFIDYFVYQFRQNEVVFSDLKALGTGLSVAGKYRPVLHARGAIAIYATIVFLLLVWKLNVRFGSRAKMSLVVTLLMLLSMIIVIGSTEGENTETWEQKGSYKNGYFFNFVLSVRDSFVRAPKGYSVSAIEELEKRYGRDTYSADSLSNDKAQNSEAQNHEAVNIIVIMNESFCDLNVIGEVQTNVPMMPFVDSLEKNTLKGYALSSVFGAKTPNSEWEYLTGNTMAFLPEGSVAYQQYLKKNAYSIVQNMSDMGYTCVAMHPYYETGWSRNRVYPMLGFDEMYFIDSFTEKQYVREYITDEVLYRQIINRFEKKSEDEKLFMMNVTMQNHGGYVMDYSNFDERVFKVGRSYTDANQYISLVNLSDQAIEKLVNYFESVDEPVEIVFFGDHQPSLSEGFYEIINGKGLSNLTKAEMQNLYKVPFFIWTNYDTPAETVDISSLNFLSTYAMERAGFELTPYERFLKDFHQVIPAINARGYYSAKEQKYKFISEATGEEKEWIEKYRMLQYNAVFDRKHRSEVFFPSSN